MAYWLRHVEAQARSGQTQRAYCAAHGLRPRNFRRWAQRLARMTQPAAGTEAPAGPSAGTRTSSRTYEAPLPEPVGQVLIAREPRRRWTDEQKLRLVEETFAPGSSVSRVSRRYGVHTSALFRWRRQFAGLAPDGRSSAPVLAPVQLVPEQRAISAPEPSSLHAARGTIEIELPRGYRVRVDQNVDCDALRRVLAVLTAAPC